MKKDKISEELGKYIEYLEAENLEQIDFDTLISVLKDSRTLLNSQNNLARDYNLLKDDIILRISGMEKAIATVTHKVPDADEVVSLAAELHNSDSEKLLRQYRKSQARFRDAFPTSFGILKSKKSQRDLSVYK